MILIQEILHSVTTKTIYILYELRVHTRIHISSDDIEKKPCRLSRFRIATVQRVLWKTTITLCQNKVYIRKRVLGLWNTKNNWRNRVFWISTNLTAFLSMHPEREGSFDCHFIRRQKTTDVTKSWCTLILDPSLNFKIAIPRYNQENIETWEALPPASTASSLC